MMMKIYLSTLLLLSLLQHMVMAASLHILHWPEDLLIHMITFTPAESISRLVLVSRFFATIYSYEHLKTRVSLEDIGRFYPLASLSLLSNYIKISDESVALTDEASVVRLMYGNLRGLAHLLNPDSGLQMSRDERPLRLIIFAVSKLKRANQAQNASPVDWDWLRRLIEYLRNKENNAAESRLIKVVRDDDFEEQIKCNLQANFIKPHLPAIQD